MRPDAMELTLSARGATVAPLSSAQERMRFLELLTPGTSLWLIQRKRRIRGRLDLDALVHALRMLQERHASLRTRLTSHEGEPMQILVDTALEIPIHDLRPLDVETREARIAGLDAAQGDAFDLEAGLLWRVTIARLSDDESILWMTFHHLICDAWSMGIIGRELDELYTARVAGRVPTLEPLEIQYADYAAWEREMMSSGVYEQQLGYWRAHLEGVRPVELPTTGIAARGRRRRAGYAAFEIPAEIAEPLRAVCTREKVQLFVGLMTAFKLLLAQYSGTNDIAVATFVANRTQAATRNVVGRFTNTLVLRTDLTGAERFVDALHRVQLVVRDGLAHQQVPFERVAATVQTSRQTSSTPFFNVLFSLYPLSGIPRLGELALESEWRQPAHVSFDLALNLEPRRDRSLSASFEYDASLFPVEMIEDLARQLQNLLVRVALEPERPLSATDIVDDATRARLRGWSATKAASAAVPARDFVSPRGPVEEALAQIWCELLGVDRVGVHDDFFALGGHSLTAMRLVARLRTTFSVELPVRTIFESPTIERLAASLGTHGSSTSASTSSTIGAARRDGPLPLSFAQQRMWFLHHLEPDNTAYRIGSARWLRGALDVEALRSALEALVHRHESLRTCFKSVEGEPRLEIRSPEPWVLVVEDRRGATPSELVELVRSERGRPFDLAAGPLMRTRLIKTADHEHLFLLHVHHIISDGWSMGVLWDEVGELFAAHVERRVPQLPSLPIQYVDYAVWQRARLGDRELQRQLAFWKGTLANAPTETALPVKGPRPPHAASLDQRMQLRIGAELANELRALALREGATLFMTLLAALRALLARYTGQSDLVIGTPTANRDRRELEGVIGMFVSTLALRSEVHADDRFVTLLAREKAVTLAAYEHQETPFELIVDALDLERRLDLSPLFQVWYVHQNMPRSSRTLGTAASELDSDEVVSKFDLALYSTERGDEIELEWHYKPDLFDRVTIERMLVHFQELLTEVVAHPDLTVRDLLLTRAPVETTRVDRPTTIWDRFVTVAKARATQIAVRERGREWTYGELHSRADSVAARLDESDAGDRVACLLTHGGEMVAGILGVLAGGRAYVPLDASHPIERTSFVLADSGARTILCDASNLDLATRLAGDRALVGIDETIKGRSPRRRPGPTSLAYCLYTSGSTGRPKGVLQEHAHVVRFIDAYCRELAIVPADVLTLLSTFSFDAAVVDVFSALLSGATLAPYDLRREGLAGLPKTLARCGVTIYHSTPTVFRALLQADACLPTQVRAVALGGEEVRADDVARFRGACAHDAILVNGYGMTECSWALLQSVRPGDVIERSTVPLGAAIDGVRVTLQTPLGPQLAIYGVGTIQIESPHVARGYWQRPEETAASFPAPCVYVTSDYGRLLPDGRIEFAGRHASLVKLRGLRIDLREIEAVLASHPQVGRAAVVLHAGPRGDELVGYIAGTNDAPAPSSEAARAFLATTLPEYMVPAIIMSLPALPLGATGKLDRKALPAPDDTRPSRGARVAPRTDREARICGVFERLLGVTGVGVHDDFFALGGNSLLAMRLGAELERVVGVRVPLREIFLHSAVEGIDQAIQRHHRQKAPLDRPKLRPTERRRGPLLAAQRGSFLLDRVARENLSNRMVLSSWLEGDPDVAALERALHAMRQRHATLRTRFFEEAGVLAQEILDVVDAPLLHREDLSTVPEEDRDHQDRARLDAFLQRSFDLDRGEVFRALLVRWSPSKHRLSVSFHHIITDPQSLEIFERELFTLWRAFAAGHPEAGVLPAPTASTVDLVDYLERVAATPIGEQQRNFWQNQLEGLTPISLPTDLPRDRVDARRKAHDGYVTFPMAAVEARLGADDTAAIERLAGTTRTSRTSVLVAALSDLVSKLTGQDDLSIIGHLLFRHLPGLERTLGFCSNPLVLRVSTAGAPPFQELVHRAHTTITEAFEHGDFDVLRRVSNQVRVFFNYHYTPSLAPPVSPTEEQLPAGLTRRERAPIRAGVQTEQAYDLNLSIDAFPDRINMRLSYNLELFVEASARRFLESYLQTLRRLTAPRRGVAGSGAGTGANARVQALRSEFHELLHGTHRESTIERVGQNPEKLYTLTPHVIERRAYDAARAATVAVYRALQLASQRILTDVELRRAMGMGPHLDMLLDLDRKHGVDSMLVRFDGFLGEDSIIRFIECNSFEPGAPPRLEEIFAHLPITQELRARYPITPLRSFERAPTAVMREQARRGRGAPTIAVLNGARGDDVMYWLPYAAECSGWRVLDVESPSLRYHDGALWVGDTQIDIVQTTLTEVMDPALAPGPLLQAVAAGAVRLSHGLSHAFSSHYKSTFEILSDPSYAAMFDIELQRVLATHIPWTRILRPRATSYRGQQVDLLELITEQRGRFVIKPSGAFGGFGVVLGSEVSAERWHQAILTARTLQCVVQERVDPGPEEEFCTLDPGTRSIVEDRGTADLNPLLWNGDDADGAVSRISATGVHNKASGGAVAPIWILEDA